MNVVVTGTSRGIGMRLAEHYLNRGESVFGCSRGSGVIEHENYFHHSCDLSDESSVSDFAKSVRQKTKTVDALINCAGAASMNHFLLTPSETAESLMKINYLSGFMLTRALSGALRRSKNGRVVNFSTVAVPLRLEGELAYGASKAAVEAMTRVLAKELAHMGITVNAVGPAPTPTDLIAKVPEEKLRIILDAQAIKRYCEFDDIANAVDFFISPNSSFITGQVIYLGGVS